MKAQKRHLGTVKVREHEIRVCLDRNGRGGSYYPVLYVFLAGPNGSAAGYGPKGWPRWLADLCGHRGRWTSNLVVPLPHVSWRVGYKLRRVGGVTAYKTVQRTYAAACGEVA